MRQYTKPWLH